MIANYSNLVYVHDIIQTIIVYNPNFVMTLLQANADDWARKIINIKYSSKEVKLPNDRAIDALYIATDAELKSLCIGFEVKSGNDIDKDQLTEELEGLRELRSCDKSYLIVIASREPDISLENAYYIPLSAFLPKIKEVLGIVSRFVKEFEKRD
ncbi:MAG: hypothetical protein RXR08_12580 [Sulfolobaceae archaeon]